jgi:hypothetical protein
MNEIKPKRKNSLLYMFRGPPSLPINGYRGYLPDDKAGVT